jgi:hypothetical protein
MAPVPCPYRGSRDTETRLSNPPHPRRRVGERRRGGPSAVISGGRRSAMRGDARTLLNRIIETAPMGEAMPDGESNDDGIAGPALAIGFILLLVAVFGAYFLFVMK